MAGPAVGTAQGEPLLSRGRHRWGFELLCGLYAFSCGESGADGRPLTVQTRRSFFRRVAAAFLGVAVAPVFLPAPPLRGGGPIPFDTAFACEMPPISPFWLTTSRWVTRRVSPEYLKAMWRLKYQELRIMARDGDVPLDTLLQAHYIGVRERQRTESAMSDVLERLTPQPVTDLYSAIMRGDL